VRAAHAQPAQMHRGQARQLSNCHFPAFQKYNSTIGFIGFPPNDSLIIDKSANLDALSI
jgi:hypothetical protein